MSLQLLRLLHLADSAFPIGATAHSFGLETLAVTGVLTPQTLQALFSDLLWETGQTEALFGRLAYQCAGGTAGCSPALDRWWELNQWLAAFKPARESREASATLGRRFLQTVAHWEPVPLLTQAQEEARRHGLEVHYCTAFGLVGGALHLGEEATLLAYLQQTLLGWVSACLRLLPIGQGRAGEILWAMKPLLVEVVNASRLAMPADGPHSDLADWLEHLTTFTPMLDLASMRHPTLPTRLFIS